MKVEGLVFALLAIFLTVTSGLYWVLSRDVTGFTCLLLTGGLTFIIGYYLLFTARRLEARPEDRPDAEISEGSGEMGFFSPHSWWPMAAAGSFALTMMGIAFGPFLVLIGFVCVLVTASGFLFEYYVGVNKTQGQTLSALEAQGLRPTGMQKFLGEKPHQG